MMENELKKQDYAIYFDNISVNVGALSILKNINIPVLRGKNTAIVGPNGAGKTTLFMAFLGQIPYEGKILTKKNISIGYVPQSLSFDRGMPIKVQEFLSLSSQKRPIWFNISERSAKNADHLLSLVEAQHLLNKPMGALSGGELQRVLLALALQREPDLLLLDEPSSGIDITGGKLFCSLLEKLRHKMGFTQLMISHDLSMVAAHSDYVVCLNRSVITQGPPKHSLSKKYLNKTFGHHIGSLDYHQSIKAVEEKDD